MAMSPSPNTAQSNQTRRTLARAAGVLIMVWGVGWAIAWMAAAISFSVMFFTHGAAPLGFGALIGGLVLAAIGAGKAAGGWILVKEDKKL